MKLLRLLAMLLLTGVLIQTATPARAATAVPPISGPVMRGFDPPDQPWLPGHRGVDLLGSVGEEVHAAMAGTVRYAGRLAGRGVVSISHGVLTTTYEPLTPSVRAGDQVEAGQVIGRLTSGHSCGTNACLHWGLKRGQTYLDPLSLLARAEVRLLPTDAADEVRAVQAAREAAEARAAAAAAAAARAAGAEGGSGVLARPAGTLGSRFGMRFHPILHIWRLHAGVDFSSACGTPIRAAAAGTVTGRSYDSASGNRLTIDHGRLGGHHLVTIYLHAQRYSVRVGQRVTRGQIVGHVGSTGLSTGCHLHLSVKADGRQVDPLRFL